MTKTKIKIALVAIATTSALLLIYLALPTICYTVQNASLAMQESYLVPRLHQAEKKALETQMRLDQIQEEKLQLKLELEDDTEMWISAEEAISEGYIVINEI